MRSLIVFLSGMIACAAAHAELLANKGSKGTLSVQYEYTATGSKKDKNAPADWRVQRTVKLVVPMIADAPSQKSPLDPNDKKLPELQKTMTPTVADMMKIADRCGDDDACVEKALQGYGETMDKSTLEKGRAQADEINSTNGPRYQKWQPVSQQGTYTVDETYHSQTADAACRSKPNQRCTREETRKGSGVIPQVAGSDVASAAAFEVDSIGKAVQLKLPVPSSVLPYTRQVTSDFPGEASGSSAGKLPSMRGEQAAITVPLTDLRAAAGTRSYEVNGEGGEGGTMKVTWQFALQK